MYGTANICMAPLTYGTANSTANNMAPLTIFCLNQ